MSNLKRMDHALVAAKTVKEAMQLTFVKELVTKNYMAITGKKDAENYFNAQVFSFLSILNEKPELKECDRFSMLGALVYVASTGLSLQDGHVDLVKYGSILKAQQNYKGHREQLRTMPSIESVGEGVLVLKGEKFTVDKANNRVIEHLSGEDVPVKSIDDIRYAYVRVTFRTLGNEINYKDVIVSQEDLKRAKSKSKNKGENSVWEQWPGQMCKKVPVHRAWTLYYRKPEASVIDFDLGAYKDDGEDIIDINVKEEQQAQIETAKQEPVTQTTEKPTPVAKPAKKEKDELDDFLSK